MFGTIGRNFKSEDKEGDVKALTRRGATGTTTFGIIDNLTMNYTGNQLTKAEDSGEAVSLFASMDFKGGAHSPVEYYYDANGNLTKDLNKGISNIAYNSLNLPMTLKDDLVMEWGSKQTDYCRNMIYKNGTLKRIRDGKERVLDGKMDRI